MARVSITFPEKILFTTTISVRITDLNYGGHLGNDTVLSLLHEARVRFLQHLGLSELNFGGVGIIMSDAAIQFKSEAFFGEELTVEVAVDDISRVAFDLYYRVQCGDRLVVIAKTGIVCYDYAAKKVAQIPAIFLDKVK